MNDGRRKAHNGWRGGALRWLEHGAAHCKHDDVLARKVDFDVYLLAIAAARGDNSVRLEPELEDVGRKTIAAVDGNRSRIAEGIDAVGHEYQSGLARPDDRSHHALISVRIEIARRNIHGEDLVDACHTDARDEAFGLLRDHRYGDRG